MHIRPASLADIPHIVEMGRAHHEQSERAHVEYDTLEVGMFLADSIVNRGGDRCVFVAEHNDELVGLIVGKLQPWPFLSWMVATDLVTISSRAGAGRALLNAFECWALLHHADEILIGVSFGGDPHSCEKIYGRAGYRHVGGMFSKKLRG